MPVPSKHLRPPRMPVPAIDVSLVEGKREEVLAESGKNMPTVEPFPMNHGEEKTSDAAATPGDVKSSE